MDKNPVSYTTIVIGGGPGGYTAAIRLAQLGVKVTLVEKDNIGGTCLNVGCIPSKALLNAAKMVHQAKHFQNMGIEFGEPKIDCPRLIEWKDKIVSRLTSGVSKLLKDNGVRVVKGNARFIEPHKILVELSGNKTELAADNLIIASGSRSAQLSNLPVDHKFIIDSTDALSLTLIPDSIAIIGGGYIGLELGTYFAKMGSKVTVIELMPQLLPGFEKDVARMIALSLKKLGVKVLTDSKVSAYYIKDDRLYVDIETTKGIEKIQCSKMLIAVGRVPYIDELGLETIGLSTDDKGFIQVDSRRQSNIKHIYAIGDITGQPMLAHKASKEGEVAAEAIAGLDSRYDPKVVPAVCFTDPEIAVVGISGSQAKEAGIDYQVGKFPYAASGRALTTGEVKGYALLLAEKSSQRIIGARIVGAGASEMISEVSLAIECNATVSDLADLIHPHPTFSETLMEAAKAIHGAAIHILNK